MINESLFEQIEDLYMRDSLINNSEAEIRSVDEIVELFKKIGSEKIKDAQSLLNNLITKEWTKHYYHLRYLSDKNRSDLFRLKLAGKPLSFIFLLSAKNIYYLVWETYQTEEATYVWRLQSSADLMMENIFHEQIELIKWLRENNKMTYLRTLPKNFKKIEHHYSGEDFGFKKWKSQLEDFLLNDAID
jgi:hypothetical protein